MTTENGIVSPQILALQGALAANQENALAAFWERVAGQGAPLIEALDDDPDHKLVTFLWRAQEELDNVLLISRVIIGSLDFEASRLTRLPGADLWYKSIRLPNGLRTTYRLAPGDPLTPLSEVQGLADWFQRTQNWLCDPLNGRTFAFPRDPEEAEDQDWTASVVALPGALPQPWAAPRPDVPAGSVEMHRFRSQILGNERRVWVYTPPGYTPDGEPYGLLVTSDGVVYLYVLNLPTILDNLLAEGRLPPLVAVTFDSLDWETRSRELCCHPPFTDFLAQELLPWVRANYHVTTEPARTVIAGTSDGGLAAVYSAWRRPELFGCALSQSGSFDWQPPDDKEGEWLTRRLATAGPLPQKFHLDIGTLEVAEQILANPLVANRHLRTVLQAKGCPVHYQEYVGGHDYVSWPGTLADGLIYLVGLK